MKTFESKDQRRLYGDLAWTWPIISPPADYVEQSVEAVELIRAHARIPVRRAVNFGCGGGHNDYTLKKYFDLTGVDISENMLALARQLNPEVKYVTGDMRSVRLGAMFDAVTIFDSINYMRTVGGLQAAFQTAYSHLKPGGVFLTFVEIWAENFRQNYTTSLLGCRDDTEITLVENNYDPDPGDTWYECHLIYLIRRAGDLTIESDCHLLGLFPLQTWLDVMSRVGFTVHQHRPKRPDKAGDYCPTLVGVKPL